ncbi:MAG TPA: Rieske 2Fe-2S domain-containing protein [Dehalococcoidia bacterium]|nr:Rieske 2Fe-2S domain-containing protein [Dehalococcoidia bacterium]
MLSVQDNELLCRVGPGTPIGDLMREYWLPVLMTSELDEPDGSPLRVRLLSEDLIAFRSTSGEVGVIQNACPHRGASLYFGRNEEDGLRCVYHGWKFDVAGSCIDMPSEPAESNFKTKVHAKTYPCVERNGVIWVYMGSRAPLPGLPQFEANMVTNVETRVQKVLRDCNWMQALEGDIDTSHLSFLHMGTVKPEDAAPGSFDYYGVRDRAPKYDVHETEFGTTYGAYRPAEDDTYYWRVANFLFPCFTMIPTGTLGVAIHVRAWVPVDDEHVMYWSINVPGSRQVGRQGQAPTERNVASGRPMGVESNGRRPGGFEYEEFNSGWLGRWRLTQNASNDYGIDRESQRSGVNYTGIPGIFQQDQAVTESMGNVYDRSHEHLGTSDAMIIRTRRRVINAAKALREGNVSPPGVDNPEVYRTRSGSVILPRSVSWLEATQDARWPKVEAGEPIENVGV